jgi:hypothetical protein
MRLLGVESVQELGLKHVSPPSPPFLIHKHDLFFGRSMHGLLNEISMMDMQV